MSDNTVLFGDMAIGDIGSCWGDDLTNLYDRPQWVTCKKITDCSVTIIAENDVIGAGISDVNVLCGKYDKFHKA